LKLIFPKKKNWITSTNDQLVELVLYGFIIWYFIENYIVFVVSYVFEMYNNYKDSNMAPRIILSSVLFFFIALASMILLISIGCSHQKLKTSKFKSLILGINQKSSLYGVIYYANFISIRFYIAFLLCLSDYIDSMSLLIMFSVY